MHIATLLSPRVTDNDPAPSRSTVNLRQIEALRRRPATCAETLLRDCLPGHLFSSRHGALSLFECTSHWQGPYVPPLDRHLVAVSWGPAVHCTTWLADEGLRQHNLQPGSLMLLPAGEPGYIRLGDPHRVLLLAIKPCELLATDSERPAEDGDLLQAGSGLTDEVIEGLALSLLAAAGQKGRSTAALGDHLARALATQLLAQHAKSPASARRRLGDARLERVLHFLDQRLADSLSLEELARVAGCSVHHLAHLFKDEMGLSPMRYLNEKRMQKARDLIETTQLSMSEIAFQVGLSSAARFSQAFRAYWQTSPSAVRRKA